MIPLLSCYIPRTKQPPPDLRASQWPLTIPYPGINILEEIVYVANHNSQQIIFRECVVEQQ